jgi:hypothetical protein
MHLLSFVAGRRFELRPPHRDLPVQARVCEHGEKEDEEEEEDMEDTLLLPIIFFVALLLAGVAYGLWAALRLYQLWTLEWDRQPLRSEATRWGTRGRQREVDRLLALRRGPARK